LPVALSDACVLPPALPSYTSPGELVTTAHFSFNFPMDDGVIGARL
jgi:hypothetical protein